MQAIIHPTNKQQKIIHALIFVVIFPGVFSLYPSLYGEYLMPLQVDVDKVSIEPNCINFGRAKESEGYLHSNVSVANNGNHVVEIEDIVSGCGCTHAKIDKAILAPDETATLSLKIDISGRRGMFKKDVYLNVKGSKERIRIPIQGTIVQDIWFDGSLIQCFAENNEVKILEKNFEIMVFGLPNIQFQYNLIDESLELSEISRTTKDDVTSIQYRLLVKFPKEQQSISRYLVLIPKEEGIKELVIPIKCYRALSQEQKESIIKLGKKTKLIDKLKNKSPMLYPDEINLGVFPRGMKKSVEIAGSKELLKTLSVEGTENLPDDTEIQVRLLQKKTEGATLIISIRLSEEAPSGLIRGKLILKSSLGLKFTIVLLGLVGPGNAMPTTKQGF